MSAKALVRALVTLAVLIVLWGGVVLVRGSMTDESVRLELPALTPADVERITIVKAADTIVLARDGSRWLVNGRPADAGRIEQMLAALRDSSASSELVARSASSHPRLGVDTSGRSVRFERGGTVLLDLILGGGARLAYVRQAGSDDVYQYRGRLPAALSLVADGWRDRSIARLVPDDVAAVRIERAGLGSTLRRDADRWLLDGTPADSAAVEALLRALEDVVAIGFATPEEADSLDFGRPDRALHVLGAAGDTLLALAFDSTATGYWTRAGGTVYRLDFWRVNQLTPTDSTLRAIPPR